jgi:hypothetical protein
MLTEFDTSCCRFFFSHNLQRQSLVIAGDNEAVHRKKLLQPYYNQQVDEQRLPADTKMLLLLDAWSVHRGEEFRRFIRTHCPWIHLVFIPANCTSKLQVADVILQRPFKHGVRKRFSQWAAAIIKDQITKRDVLGLNPHLKMSVIKPLCLQWCFESWNTLKQRKDFITFGWHTCVLSMYNVNDPQKRLEPVEAVAKGELTTVCVPTQDEVQTPEQAEAEEEEDEEDEEKDELDVMKERVYGERKSERKRTRTQLYGYQISSTQVELVQTGCEDSEAKTWTKYLYSSNNAN